VPTKTVLEFPVAEVAKAPDLKLAESPPPASKESVATAQGTVGVDAELNPDGAVPPGGQPSRMMPVAAEG
jgi:hypothetical protein